MHKPRKLALAVLASITIAGIAGASASSLGGLDGGSVGSDDAITASCQTSGNKIAVSYGTQYNPTLAPTPGFEVASVTFKNVDATCAGKAANVVLADGTGAALTSGSVASVVLASGEFSITVPGVSAKAVEKLSLVIQG